MLERLVLYAPSSVEDSMLRICREYCQSLASATAHRVSLVLDSRDPLVNCRAPSTLAVGEFLPNTISVAPMGAADVVWRDDGRPDWAAMWTSFCELALYGGPPHRGEEQTLRARPEATPEPLSPAMTEIRRGIWETTGLFAEPAEPGWVAVTCESTRMAAWLCATIIFENVEARCEAERLLVPASPSFVLEDEVKSVITVVAKTVHYWQQHSSRPSSVGVA